MNSRRLNFIQRKDCEELDIKFDLFIIELTFAADFKKNIKDEIRAAALKYLKIKQQSLSKVKDIQYPKLETQAYLKSPLLSNEENSLLFALRTRTARTFKGNFSHFYGGQIAFPLNCWDPEKNEPSLLDSQEHILVCTKLKISNNIAACDKIDYSDIFKEPQRQKEIVALYKILIEEREKILQAES